MNKLEQKLSDIFNLLFEYHYPFKDMILSLNDKMIEKFKNDKTIIQDLDILFEMSDDEYKRILIKVIDANDTFKNQIQYFKEDVVQCFMDTFDDAVIDAQKEISFTKEQKDYLKKVYGVEVK